MQDYPSRLKLPIEGHQHKMIFTRHQKIWIAAGYERIVIGQRGPYMEFNEEQVFPDTFKKVDAPHVYYTEYRTEDGVKIYHQIKTVDYADYRPGFYYVSPFDLEADGQRIIEELPRKKKPKPT